MQIYILASKYGFFGPHEMCPNYLLYNDIRLALSIKQPCRFPFFQLLSDVAPHDLNAYLRKTYSSRSLSLPGKDGGGEGVGSLDGDGFRKPNLGLEQ